MIPQPDPATPGRVTIVPYSMVLPAVTPRGRIIPHLYFRCYFPVKGRRRCVEFWRS